MKLNNLTVFNIALQKVELNESAISELQEEVTAVRGQLELLLPQMTTLQDSNTRLRQEKLALINTRDTLQNVRSSAPLVTVFVTNINNQSGVYVV